MLEAQKLAARRGFSRLFTGVSFRVDAGEALVVTGANGTGKTTLLRMLAGLTAPESGEIRWQGRRAGPLDAALRASIAFAGHLPSLKDELTAEENLASLVALEGAALSREAIGDALDNVALSRQRALPARCFRRVSADASASRDCRSFRGRCGSWTSPWPPSTLPAPNSWRAF